MRIIKRLKLPLAAVRRLQVGDKVRVAPGAYLSNMFGRRIGTVTWLEGEDVFVRFRNEEEDDIFHEDELRLVNSQRVSRT